MSLEARERSANGRRSTSVRFAVNYADLVAAVSVPVADNGGVVVVAELVREVAVAQTQVTGCIDMPDAVAIDAEVVAAVAVEIADDGQVAGMAEPHDDVGIRQLVIAVEIKREDAVGKHADVLPARV